MNLSEIRDELHCVSQTPLAAGGNYTSTWQQVRYQPITGLEVALPYVPHRLRVKGLAFSDQASAVNGLIIEQSVDGVAVHAQAFLTLPAAGFVGFDVLIIAKYVRVNFTNGAVGQADFDLAAYLSEV